MTMYSETYDTLCFHDNSVIADKAEPVEDDEVNDEFNESFDEGTEVNDNMDIEYKKMPLISGVHRKLYGEVYPQSSISTEK